jgi:hypothetical protein
VQVKISKIGEILDAPQQGISDLNETHGIKLERGELGSVGFRDPRSNQACFL